MTHWVIMEHKGKLYAGVDKLASTGPEVSELLSDPNRAVAAPNSHDTSNVTKYLQYKNSVLCICGNNIPSGILGILEDCLGRLNFAELKSAEQLLKAISSDLQARCSKTTFILGCGLATSSLSIAYMHIDADAKTSAIEAVTSQYVNSELVTKKPYIIPNGGAALELDEAEFYIEDEISRKSISRYRHVGRVSDIITLSPAQPSVSQSTGLFQNRERSSRRDHSNSGDKENGCTIL